MTLTELSTKLGELLPNAVFERDLQGQLVIYTGVKVVKDDTLVPLEIEAHEEDEVVTSMGGE